jgi:enterochelin esterase family protein
VLLRLFRRVAVGAAAIVLAVGGPATFAGPGQGEVLLDQTVTSPALGRELAYSIYMPPGYPVPGKRYPVIYLFHGVGGDQRSWLNPTFTAIVDGLIDAERLQPVLIVTPAVDRSFCVDSAEIGGPGDFDTAIRRDLIQAIEEAYPVVRARAGRAVAGNSMGGFCALHLSFEPPFAFAAVAAMSGGFFTTRPPPQLPEALFDRVFGPGGAASARYTAANPITEIHALPAAEAPDTYLSAGAQDGLGLAADNVQLGAAMRAAGLPVTVSIDDAGGHDWRTWLTAAPEALVFLSRHLRSD